MNGLHPDAGPRTRTPHLMQGQHARTAASTCVAAAQGQPHAPRFLVLHFTGVHRGHDAEGRKWVSGDSRWR